MPDLSGVPVTDKWGYFCAVAKLDPTGDPVAYATQFRMHQFFHEQVLKLNNDIKGMADGFGIIKG